MAAVSSNTEAVSGELVALKVNSIVGTPNAPMGR